VKRILVWFLVVLALLSGTTWALITKSHLLPRTGLPDFDPQKAAQLSPTQRKAYEQELFSELWRWNMGSRHYPHVQDIARREQRWREMAANGLELAHITLRVLQPEGGRIYALAGPVRRLEDMATTGDVGAMCLISELVNVAAAKHDPEPYQDTARRWLLKGVELGHPQCQIQLGRRLMRGVPGYGFDPLTGLDLEFAGRTAGYSHEVGELVRYYEAKGFTDTENVRRLYCWMGIYESFQPEYVSKLGMEGIEQKARLSNDSELVRLADERKASNYMLQDCVKFGKGR
jgi:hypothetical protein